MSQGSRFWCVVRVIVTIALVPDKLPVISRFVTPKSRSCGNSHLADRSNLRTGVEGPGPSLRTQVWRKKGETADNLKDAVVLSERKEVTVDGPGVAGPGREFR